MAVQVYPSPGLLPTSQEAGGTVHSNELAQTAPGSLPGYDGGTMQYNVSTDSPGPMSSAQDDRNPMQPSGSMGSAPADSPFPQAGGFGVVDEDTNAAKWKRTPSSS